MSRWDAAIWALCMVTITLCVCAIVTGSVGLFRAAMLSVIPTTVAVFLQPNASGDQ